MDLEQALYQRGHVLTHQGRLDDIFVPKSNKGDIKNTFANLLYNLMSEPDFRSQLRDWTFDKCEPQIVNSYFKLCNHFDKDKFGKDQNIYSHTFEWFISEFLKRKFGAKVSGFNLNLKDAPGTDEFDVLAILDEGVVFVECKTGKGTFVDGIQKYVNRDKQICAKYSMFIFDNENFLKGPDDFEHITKKYAIKCGITKLCKYEKFGVYNFLQVTVAERHFLVISAFEKLENNIRHVIRFTNMVNDRNLEKVEEYIPEIIPFID